MAVAGLVTLALLLNAVAVALAFLYVRRDFRLTLNAQTRKIRAERRAALEARQQLEVEISDLREAFKQVQALMGPEKNKGLILGATFRDRMEDRYVADAAKSKTVIVDGVPAQPH